MRLSFPLNAVKEVTYAQDAAIIQHNIMLHNPF